MLFDSALSGCTMNSPVEGKTETTTAAKTTERCGNERRRQAVQQGRVQKAKIGLLAPTLQTEFFINIGRWFEEGM